ncbi:MAG TPA: glycosyltransferase [Roseivirga sp.]
MIEYFQQMYVTLGIGLKWVIIFYTVVLFVIYFNRVVIAAITNLAYKKNQTSIDEQVASLARSPLAVGISIIAPAYNESATIVENIRSLLMVKYPQYELIVVNDGSKDDSLEKAINAYDLMEVEVQPFHQLRAKEVISIYKSRNPSFSRLILVNKVNGGKSDALNAGINYAQYPLVACMDVDSIFTKNALLKLALPFMTDPKVIASGSAIRIANSSKVEFGHLRKVHLPKGFWERFQVLEYLRAFLLGRMSLSKINGLPLVSGASGLFKKSLVVNVGGYDHATVGEDMELIMSMRRYCYEHQIEHRIQYIPDPVCWTEAPHDPVSLKRQRNRWTRGSIEALLKHKKMIFNPKYGILGMYSLPYWLLYEIALPIYIFFGTIFLGIGLAVGFVDTNSFLLLYLFGYVFSLFVTLSAILIEELTYRQYSKVSEVITLMVLALFESFVYQPISLYWSLTGIFDKLTNKKVGWGTISRAGFNKAAA